MKTIFKMAAFCFAAATILVSCGDKVTGPEDIRVESVSVTPETKTLGITETVQLQVAITPTDATNKNVEWDSSDDAIATVSDSGLVTAVAEGTATITVTTVDGGKTDTCVITVGDGSIDPEVPVQSVSLSPETQNIPVGGNFTLTESVMPFEATNKSVTWSSSNDQVASVTDGVVTGVAVGTATITVTTVDGAFTDDCVVTVVSASPVTDVEFAYDSYNLPFGRKHKLTATIVPSNAVNKRLTWESSNSTIASVDQTGLVTVGSTAGTATITVTTEEGGFEATCEIKVVNAIGFLSDRTWTVDTQTWSDAVMVPACGKKPAT